MFSSFVKQTVQRNTLKREQFQAGRLKNFVHEWDRITSDPVVLNAVSGFKIPFTSMPIQHKLPVPIAFSSEEQKQIQQELTRLVKCGVLIPCEQELNDFVSNIFLMPKRNGQFRMILNLKELNKFIPYHHFKMEGLHNAVAMMSKDCFMASIDLADAYYCCPCSGQVSEIFKFQFHGTFYKYSVSKWIGLLPTHIYQTS